MCAQRLAHHLRGPVRNEVVHVLLQHVARDPEDGPLVATPAEDSSGGGACLGGWGEGCVKWIDCKDDDASVK